MARINRDPANLARVAALPCLVCGARAEVHHVRTGCKGKDDRRVVPLCPTHHRGHKGFHGLGSEQAFFDLYGIWLSDEAERIERERHD